MSKKLTSKKDGHQNKRALHDLKIVVVVSSLSIIAWLFFFYATRTIFGLTDRIYNVIVLIPIILIIMHLLHEMHVLSTSKNEKNEIDSLKKELKMLKAFSAIIPTLLFGIGTIFAYEKKIMHKVVPFLIFAALFGTIIPNLLMYITFDYHNLDKLLLITNIDFSVTSYAFAYLLCTVLVFVKSYKV